MEAVILKLNILHKALKTLENSIEILKKYELKQEKDLMQSILEKLKASI